MIYYGSLLLATNAVVGIETLSGLASKVALRDQLIQQLDGCDQVVINLSLLAPAVNNEFHGIQAHELT